MGRRTSESYYRLYDKGVESGKAPPNTMWRLELEAKGGHANSLLRDICEAPNEPEQCYQRLVSSWRQAGFSWPLPGRPSELPPVARPADKEPEALGLAIWLQTSVNPVVSRLRKVFSTSELLQMLGLDGVAVAKEIADDERGGTPRDPA